MAYRPAVIDVPIVGLNQAPPDHGGPQGRATSLKDAQVTHYTPPAVGVQGKVKIEAREAFVSMPVELRDSVTGAVDSTTGWSNPELLATLGDQLLAIADSKPRVFNGATWTTYGQSRVVTNQLSEDVIHTTNHVLQATDSAHLNGVTCFVWTETSHVGPVVLNTTMAAFRADDGAWVRLPFQLFQNAAGNALARVVSDGTHFWVVFNTGNKIAINVYDTHGVLAAFDSTTVPLSWTPTPGYWDIAAFIPGGNPYVLIAQPDGFSTVGANVGVRLYRCTVAGAVITITNSKDVTVSCTGPVAFMTTPDPATNTNDIIVTVGTSLFSVEYNAGFATHFYAFGAVLGGSGIPDSLTGWMDLNGGVPIAHVAYSLLSNFSPTAGPPNDPGLRYTRSYACTRAGAVTLTNQVNGVLLSSRAFQIDDDWYAATYYQSGGGLITKPAADGPLLDGAFDYMIGAPTQPLTVSLNDLITGSPITATSNAAAIATTNARTRIYIVPSQAIGGIAHTGGDNANAATQTWTFAAGTFATVAPLSGASAYNSYLHVAGAANAGNNGSFRVIAVLSATQVVTELVSTTFGTMVTEAFGGGVTASLISTTTIAVSTEERGSLFPPGSENFYTGTAVLSGNLTNGANAASYTVFRALTHTVFPGSTTDQTMLLCTPVGTNVLEAPSPSGVTLVLTQALVNGWVFSGATISTRAGHGDAGNVLVVTGTGADDSPPGGWPITSTPLANVLVTGGQTGLVPNRLGAPLPQMEVDLVDASQAYHFFINGAAFDNTYLLAYITLTGADNPINDGIYQISQIIGPHEVIALPVDGRTGVRNETLSDTATVSIQRSGNQYPAIQPCWFLMPLSVKQRAAGRWEWGIAYADWRFDGNTRSNPGTFERNGYPLALSSVVPTPSGKALSLPYRAQSFTAGQVVGGAANPVGIAQVAESTVGLKLFSIANAPGQASVNAGEMLLPGMQASQFSLSGFPEDGINLGFEQPFLIGKATVVTPLAPTLLSTRQYVVVAEVTNESGDRVWSVVSPPLDVTLQGTENQITIGGRMPGPTNRLVGIAIYSTVTASGVPTVQHYKLTNDLDVNGTGFSFTSLNGGADADTWQFIDGNVDAAVLSAEVVYTDKGLLQRFPAPANSQGFASWKGRNWVVGYDGAVWMSAEKQEGDAVWYHPAFRYTAFGDDAPVAVCGMDDYMLVFCTRTVWYIPAATFPDATGRNGTLPTPVQLPVQNGGTGFTKALRVGVAYSSSAGGVWLLTRDLRNVWLSEAVRDSMGTVNGMAINGAQRLAVSTVTGSVFIYDQVTEGWWEWTLPAAPVAPAVLGGAFAILDLGGYVMQQAAGVYLDNRGGATFPIVPDITFNSLNFGGVRAFKCLWAMQIVGEYKGQHRLNVVMTYPDDDHVPTVFKPWTPDPTALYIFEVNPMLEEASSFGVRIYCDFVGVATPGNSFTLELLSCEVGMEPGINRIPSGRRISGT